MTAGMKNIPAGKIIEMCNKMLSCPFAVRCLRQVSTFYEAVVFVQHLAVFIPEFSVLSVSTKQTHQSVTEVFFLRLISKSSKFVRQNRGPKLGHMIGRLTVGRNSSTLFEGQGGVGRESSVILM